MEHLSKSLGIVLAAVLVTGCASSQEATSDTTDSPAPSVSVSTGEDPSPTEEPTPTTAPSTGPIAEIEGIRVNLPEGWHRNPPSAMQAVGYNSDPGTTIELFRFPQGPMESVDELAHFNAQSTLWGPRPKRRADVTVDGLIAIHLSGKSPNGYVREVYETLSGQQDLVVTFVFANDESKAVRDEIVQSVLASWKFTN